METPWYHLEIEVFDDAHYLIILRKKEVQKRLKHRCENLPINYGGIGLRLRGLSGGTWGLSGDTRIGTNENEETS